MQRTSSYLKGLAETRARAAGDVQRLEQLHAEITAQLEAARAEVTSCDLLIRKFDRQLDPTKIPAIQAWRRHYGKRGEFRAAILRMLEASWPESVSTLELAAQLQLEFKLDFINSKERTRWIHNSLTSRLKLLARTGDVTREADIRAEKGLWVARWRWASPTVTELGALRDVAQATGVGVQQAKKRGRPRKAEAVTL